jgi:hypothetical protein
VYGPELEEGFGVFVIKVAYVEFRGEVGLDDCIVLADEVCSANELVCIMRYR